MYENLNECIIFIGLTGLWYDIIKTSILNLVRTTRFWNNRHQVHPKPKYLKSNVIKVFWSMQTNGPEQDSLFIVVF